MRRSPTWLLAALLSAGLTLALPEKKPEKPSPHGAVATEHPLSTRAAIEILEHGGNAVDAAVAAALVAGVVGPSSSGIGGGGFALVYLPGESKPKVLDFREVAPQKVDRSALERRPLPFPERGHLVGVPGEVRGLFELTQRFGRRRWSELVASAERHARLGFAVSAHLAAMLSGSAAADLQQEPGLKSVFFPGSRAAALGRVVTNPKLAKTLRRLAAEGDRALYDGTIASEIADTVRKAGAELSVDDLAHYQTHEREPLQISWAGYDIFTMPPPSAGGVLLAETLGMISREELVGLGFRSGAYQHLLAEAFRESLADRFRFIGDPEFAKTDLPKLLEPARLQRQRRRLALDRTHSLPLLASEEHGTHHLVVADRSGMIVSLTTTVNRVFGAKLVTPDSGIVLNDQLDDFTLTSDVNALGIADNPNAPRPSARPTSSMTPTIVVRGGRPVFALGGSGGMAITTNVAQLLLGRLAFGKSLNELSKVPRFFIPIRGDRTILLEAGEPPGLAEDLGYRGERVGNFSFVTAVQMLAWEGGGFSASADPRKYGNAQTAKR